LLRAFYSESVKLRHFPPNAKANRSMVSARKAQPCRVFFDSAAKLASAIGVTADRILLIHVGWRWSFAATGFISFLYFILFTECTASLRMIQDSRHKRAIIQGNESVDVKNPPESAIASLGILTAPNKSSGLALGLDPTTIFSFFLLTWLPSYLASELPLGFVAFVLYTGAPWYCATVVDLLVGVGFVDF